MNRTAARSVTVIPPTINPLTHLSRVAVQKRRVAGYARVSTDSDEQFTSYEAQVDYYTQYIKRNPEWEFVKVYLLMFPVISVSIMVSSIMLQQRRVPKSRQQVFFNASWSINTKAEKTAWKNSLLTGIIPLRMF